MCSIATKLVFGLGITSMNVMPSLSRYNLDYGVNGRRIKQRRQNYQILKSISGFRLSLKFSVQVAVNLSRRYNPTRRLVRCQRAITAIDIKAWLIMSFRLLFNDLICSYKIKCLSSYD
jgi:hypothetical protein